MMPERPTPSTLTHAGSSEKSFAKFLQDRLSLHPPDPLAFNSNGDLGQLSAVLFLLGPGTDGSPELILNKRSRKVRQPGDLCCPGGGVSPKIDHLLARWLRLPAPPLSGWPRGRWYQRHRPADWPKLALLLATALREGFEEMRLNPLAVQFIGTMPVQHLVMFKRAIYPLVGWVQHQKRFFPNWEVEKIVRIPLETFFDGSNYACCRISFQDENADSAEIPYRDMPCFVHRQNGRAELLWGATYRLTETFLSMVFDYTPPPITALPVISQRLNRRYLGAGNHS